MDIEFHYHVTYILAKKAGFSREDSAIIAYSSQYTDDNCNQYYINSLIHEDFISKPSQTMNITKPSIKKISIYPIFHFFPGDPNSPTASRKDGITHPFNTTPDSDNVRYVFQDALQSNDLYRIGVATHVYADSWAHQNFLGLEDVFNAEIIKEKSILNIGHATAGYNPDLVGNKWTDHRLIGKNEKIDNNERFLEAAEKIFLAYKRHLNSGISDEEIRAAWNTTVHEELKQAMEQGNILGSLLTGLGRKARIRAYNKICGDIPAYDKDAWRHDAVFKAECETDLFDCYWAKDKFDQSHWHHYQKAVRDHYDLSMQRLKPIYAKYDTYKTRFKVA